MYGLRELHYAGLLRQQVGYYAKLKTAFLESNSYDILFLGSSRVEMHYDTRLFDSLTGRNSFNLGLSGATPQLAYAALTAYLQNSKAPEYLYYEVDYHSLDKRSTEIKNFNNYFPLLKNKTLREQFNRMDGRMNQFYYNPYLSWPYTGFKNLSTGIHNWLNIYNRTDTLYYKGFMKEIILPPLDYLKTKEQYSFFDVTNRNYLDSIILLCKKKQIYITLISSPMFGGGKIGVLNKQQITNQIYNIATINHINYIDLSSMSFCNQRHLFADDYHLNYSGAIKFTRRLSDFFNGTHAN